MQPNSFLAIIGTMMLIVALSGGILIEGFGKEEQQIPETPNEQPIGNKTTGYWVRELDETGTTIVPSGPRGTPFSTISYPYNVKENALESYINLTSLSDRPMEDLDLTVYNAKGEEAGSSAGQTAEEQVHLRKKDMEKGGAGEWEAEIQTFTGGFLILIIEYQITADVFYNSTNETGNNTKKQNKEYSHLGLILIENYIAKIEEV